MNDEMIRTLVRPGTSGMTTPEVDRLWKSRLVSAGPYKSMMGFSVYGNKRIGSITVGNFVTRSVTRKIPRKTVLYEISMNRASNN